MTERPEERLPGERKEGFLLNIIILNKGALPQAYSRPHEKKEGNGGAPRVERYGICPVFAYSAHKSRTAAPYLTLQILAA